MKNYDVIIAGAGLGGLIAGAKLAKNGRKVLVIEQHYMPGGCATTFRRKDYRMEVSLHEMDGLDEQDPKRKILKELGVFDHVDFIKVPELYRIYSKRTDLIMPDSPQQVIRVLTEAFPREERGIRKFFKTLQGIRKEVNRLPRERWKVALLYPVFPLLYPNLVFNTCKSLGSFLDSIIRDEDLKLILSANLGYYHDDPYTMSLIYFSAAQASYYNGGGYYIRGGSGKLSEYLAEVIRKNGGKILLRNLVTRIITSKGKAIGVEYQSRSAGHGEIKKDFAEIIVANAAVPNVVAMLSGNEQLFLRKKVDTLEKACSLLIIYIGFKKRVKDLGNSCYSTFVVDSSVTALGDLSDNFRGEYSRRGFVFVDYSQIDAQLAPEGKGFGSICMVDYLSAWNHLGPEEYKKKKQQVAQVFFRRLEKVIPGVTNEIDCYEVGTPKTIQRYTLNPAGSVYGFAQIPKQAGLFRLANKSPVKNLYFASAWSRPGGGFTGAILSGWFCAEEVDTVLGRR